uniref:Poxvirus late transcription factor VLTF3 n=1 Tax=Clandestinovirus TaxID=2831644 RepID=A0A8F8KME2_9VIRU|nr:poxvirus late transcription factor VLTF3 [Clandestinovirus]
MEDPIRLTQHLPGIHNGLNFAEGNKDTLLTFDDTEHSEASSCPAYEQVCSDSPETVIREDYQRKMSDLRTQLANLEYKEQMLLQKPRVKDIAINHIRRQITDVKAKMASTEQTVVPFLKAVEQNSLKNADEVKRRYLEQICKVKTKQSSTSIGGKVLQTKGSDRYCQKCKCPRYVDELSNTYVCRICASSVEYLDNHTSNVSYGKHCTFQKPIGYEHVNHFRKLLMHIQAKERTVVEPEVINALRHEFSRSFHKGNSAHINAHTIRQKLKKIGRSDLYPNIPQIELILTGRPPVRLTEKQQRVLIQMFHKHRAAFEEYKEKHRQRYNSLVGPLKKKGARKNLLYYSYLLGKFAEIKKWDWLRDRVNQLKSVDCLHHHDRIHREVCKILGWPFHETSAANKRNKINLLKALIKNANDEKAEVECAWGPEEKVDEPCVDEQPKLATSSRKRKLDESSFSATLTTGTNKRQKVDNHDESNVEVESMEF